jgi:hypothetical protein
LKPLLKSGLGQMNSSIADGGAKLRHTASR